MPRKLGSKQTAVLKALHEHNGWHPQCGWLWDTQSGTERVMESLVRAGVAIKRERVDYRTEYSRWEYVPVKDKVCILAVVKGKRHKNGVNA